MTKNLESLKTLLKNLSYRSGLSHSDDVEERIRSTLIYGAKRSIVLVAGMHILSKKEVDLLYEYNDTLTFY